MAGLMVSVDPLSLGLDAKNALSSECAGSSWAQAEAGPQSGHGVGLSVSFRLLSLIMTFSPKGLELCMVNQPCLPSGFIGQLLSKYLRSEGERQAGGI